MKRLLETIACGLLLLVLTAPSTHNLWAQATSTVNVRGKTAAGAFIPLAVDASGIVQTSGSISGVGTVNISGVTPASGAFPVLISGVNTPTLATESNVAPTLSGVQITQPNANIKAICFSNHDAVYNAYVGTVSPIASTSGKLIPPTQAYCRTVQVPTNAWYMIGQSSVQAVVNIEVDQ